MPLPLEVLSLNNSHASFLMRIPQTVVGRPLCHFRLQSLRHIALPSTLAFSLLICKMGMIVLPLRAVESQRDHM